MQIKQENTELDIFVSTKIGSFKHVKYNTDATKNSKKCIENLVDIKTLRKDEGITCMEWGNQEQTEILLGKKNQVIHVYNTDGTFHRSYTADHGSGHVVGLGRCHRRLVSALSSGVVKIWSKKEPVLVNTGGKLDRMRACTEDEVFATGGEENDLKIYRMGEPEAIFAAKNLPHDWLQLRRPLWVSDLSFCPGEGGKTVAVCSRYGYVRLYDTRAQRRPVCNIELEKMAATCISPGIDARQALVGFGRGQLHVVDFRASRLDKGFKGCAGAVAGAAVCGRLVVSASLDRHLRVHCYHTKQLLYKQYLTSKLSGVLIQSEGSTPLRNAPDVKEVKEEADVEEVEEVEDDLDQLFEGMETVGAYSKALAGEMKTPMDWMSDDKARVQRILVARSCGDRPVKYRVARDKPKKKKLPPESTKSKKMKPSLEGSTIDVENEQDLEEKEDAIKKLLRSTEKQKRKMEKKKKEKKAKSVFHNA